MRPEKLSKKRRWFNGRRFICRVGLVLLLALEGGAAAEAIGAKTSETNELWESTVVINEFMANPQAVTDNIGEWIELYNFGEQPVDLAGFRLQTQSAEYVIESSLIVEPGAYLVLCREMDSAANGGATCDYQYSGLSLVNGQGELGLEHDGQRLTMNYEDGLIQAGQSLELVWAEKTGSNGLSRENFSPQAYAQSVNWQIGTARLGGGDQGTPGAANSSPAAENPATQDQSALMLTEILPNPEGADGPYNEFVEIFNTGTEPIALDGIQLTNKKGELFVLEDSQALPAQNYLVLFRQELGFSLYNEDGRVALSDAKGQALDILAFKGSAKAGQSLNKNGQGELFWSATPTPGAAGKKDEASEEKESGDNGEEEAVIDVSDWTELDFLEDKTLIRLRGTILSPWGVAERNSFYLGGVERGVLVETAFLFAGEPGEVWEFTGVLNKTATGLALEANDVREASRVGDADIVWNDLGNYLERGDQLLLVGGPVFFEGLFERASGRYLFFRDSIGREFRVYLGRGLRLELIQNFQQDSHYRIQGILEETSAGLRVLAVTADFGEQIEEAETEESAAAAVQLVKNKTTARESTAGARTLKREAPSSLVKSVPESGSRLVIGENFQTESEENTLWRVQAQNFWQNGLRVLADLGW